MRTIQGIEDLGLFRVIGQPNLNFTVDREQAARYRINVADVQDAIQTAVGGNAVTQVLQGEQRYDLVLRYLPQYRDTQGSHREYPPAVALRRARLAGAALQQSRCSDGASEIYREGELALRRDQVQRARPRPGQHGGRGHPEGRRSRCKLPRGLSHRLGGRVREPEARRRSGWRSSCPLTILVIFIILYTMFHSFKWALLILANVAMAPHRRPAGAAGHRHATSASRRASDSWRCSASPCRPA